VQQRNLERHLGVPVADRTGLDPGHLRRARPEPRGQAAGGAGAAAVPVHPARAPAGPTWSARRGGIGTARRPGRDADRAGPPHDRRAHQDR
jgi:hypothetical protein